MALCSARLTCCVRAVAFGVRVAFLDFLLETILHLQLYLTPFLCTRKVTGDFLGMDLRHKIFSCPSNQPTQQLLVLLSQGVQRFMRVCQCGM